MRRVGMFGVVVAMAMVGCGPGPASIGHGRQGSWARIAEPAFTVGASYAITGLVAPGEGYPAWTAVGSTRTSGLTAARAAAWSSADGVHWGRVDLDHGGGRGAVAVAGTSRQGITVVVGTVTTVVGGHDAAAWASSDGATWQLTPMTSAGGDQRATSVAAGPLGFIAAGVDDEVPAVWLSPDGARWTRVGSGPGGPFIADARITSVAVGQAGAVAVGTINTGGDVDGMAWFSANGTTWRSVPLGLAGLTGRGEQVVYGVTATSRGFVAVGADSSGERRVAVAWTSSDGITWQRQAQGGMVELPGTADTRGVAARSVAGRGPVLSVGGSSSVQVWSSLDGRRWTREEPPVERRYSADGSVVATDGTAVLVSAGVGGLWFRMPGGRWADAATDANVFPRPASAFELNAVVRAGGRYVLFGDDGGRQALWLSSDGRAWANQPDAGGVAGGSVAGVAVGAGVMVAAGTTRSADLDGQVAAVWVSRDNGSTWQPVDVGSPAFAIRPVTQMFDVAAGGPGFVAVGLSYDRDTIDAQAWSSTDGRSWRRSSEPAEWSGRGDQVLGDVCALPDGRVVALGTAVVQGEQDAWAWVSRDGLTWEQATGPGASVLRGPGFQFVRSCVSTPTGVLVTGAVEGPGGADAALWWTTDGRSWSKTTEPFGGPTNDSLRGIAVDGNRVVVTGVEDGDVTVYSSKDLGATWHKTTSATFGGGGFQVAAKVVIVDEEVLLAGVDGSSIAVWIGPAP